MSLSRKTEGGQPAMLGLSQANILWQTGFSGRVVQDHL